MVNYHRKLHLFPGTDNSKRAMDILGKINTDKKMSSPETNWQLLITKATYDIANIPHFDNYFTLIRSQFSWHWKGSQFYLTSKQTTILFHLETGHNFTRPSYRTPFYLTLKQVAIYLDLETGHICTWPWNSSHLDLTLKPISIYLDLETGHTCTWPWNRSQLYLTVERIKFYLTLERIAILLDLAQWWSLLH